MPNDENDDNQTTPFIRDDGDSTSMPQAPYRASSAPPDRRPGAEMFGNFAAAKNRKSPKWALPLLTAVFAFHIVLFVTMWIKSIWEIEMLERPKTQVDLAVAPPPPPAAPPPPGGAKPQTTPIVPKKLKVKDIVQPMKMEKQEQQQQAASTGSDVVSDEYCDPASGNCGTGPGVTDGIGDTPIEAPPPPPPPAAPTNVPPTLLEGSRIAGEKQIVPDDVTKTEIQRSGKDKIIGSFKLCIDATGAVTSVKMLKGTGFAAYDSKIQGKMRGEWKYRPYAVNGRAVPVCTVVTFIYSQK